MSLFFGDVEDLFCGFVLYRDLWSNSPPDYHFIGSTLKTKVNEKINQPPVRPSAECYGEKTDSLLKCCKELGSGSKDVFLGESLRVIPTTLVFLFLFFLGFIYDFYFELSFWCPDFMMDGTSSRQSLQVKFLQISYWSLATEFHQRNSIFLYVKDQWWRCFKGYYWKYEIWMHVLNHFNMFNCCCPWHWEYICWDILWTRNSEAKFAPFLHYFQ